MKIFIVITLTLAVIIPAAHASDADSDIAGVPLSDQEMDEVRGGFSAPDGNFIYFSMDLMQVRFLSHNEPGSADATAFVNSLSQRTFITKDGMGIELQVIQAGNAVNETGPPSSPDSILDSGGANLPPSSQITFTGNSGISSLIGINGNFNTAVIGNVLNINIFNISVQDASQLQPLMQNWMLPF
ncbi:MAG: hypothetical protein HZA16_10030 [Nitrospirae bacterium]|nr:hypothetical protein [Nitrospirota bacterium]